MALSAVAFTFAAIATLQQAALQPAAVDHPVFSQVYYVSLEGSFERHAHMEEVLRSTQLASPVVARWNGTVPDAAQIAAGRKRFHVPDLDDHSFRGALG